MPTIDYQERYASIKNTISNACQTVSRDPDGVCLVAVSKKQPVEAIQALYDLGHRDFGESYVQEWSAKASQLPSDIRWHFIGHLQSNKAAQLASLPCTLFHALDSEKLARRLNAKLTRPLSVTIEINVGAEASKAGIEPNELSALAEACSQLANIDIRGVMAIPPFGQDCTVLTEQFQALARLSDVHDWPVVSMGMSADFELAIKCGSTHVRVGTALFGPRSTS